MTFIVVAKMLYMLFKSCKDVIYVV